VILTDEDIENITNSKNSLTKKIYERLMAMFLNNELVPGQILNRRDLAKEMGVSVAPVLEALVQLEAEGFIESIPGKGTIIKPIQEHNLYERIILREALECTAARLYAGQLIRQNQNELIEYAEKIDQEDYSDLSHFKTEIVFHASLVNLTGLTTLTREYLKAVRIDMFCRLNMLHRTSSVRAGRYSHLGLVKKLAVKSPDEAEKIIREHLWSGFYNTLLGQRIQNKQKNRLHAHPARV
jgi:DNA-binding GntR family transcriptional regulator